MTKCPGAARCTSDPRSDWSRIAVSERLSTARSTCSFFIFHSLSVYRLHLDHGRNEHETANKFLLALTASRLSFHSFHSFVLNATMMNAYSQPRGTSTPPIQF